MEIILTIRCYYFVIMVDKKRAVDRSAPAPILIYSGCNPRVASAVGRFSKRWDRYSVRSRRYPIYVLIAETVDRPWLDYLASLPKDYPGRVLCEGQLISIIAERNGFRFLDDLFSCIENCAKSELRLHDWIRSNDVIFPLANDRNLKRIHNEFEATVMTLRELARRCGRKEPKKTKVGKLNARRLRPYCALCGEPTELAAILKGNVWPEQDPNRKASLSSRYCPNHRPKLHDGTWNPLYQRAKRNKGRFEHEIFKIEHHTANVPSISIAKSKGIGDPFLWNLAHGLDIVLFEDERIRNLARELVDAKISVRKRQIIMLLATGETQSVIARRLGISRQAISKAIASDTFQRIFVMYRPDSSPSHRAEHHTTH